MTDNGKQPIRIKPRCATRRQNSDTQGPLLVEPPTNPQDEKDTQSEGTSGFIDRFIPIWFVLTMALRLGVPGSFNFWERLLIAALMALIPTVIIYCVYVGGSAMYNRLRTLAQRHLGSEEDESGPRRDQFK